MRTRELANFAPYVRQLFLLASGSFEWDHFKQACLSHGWVVTSDDGPEVGNLWFRLAEDLELRANLGQHPWAPSAYVPVYYAGDGEELDPDFVLAFAAARETISVELGRPEAQGFYTIRSAKRDGFRYAAWRGESGLFAVVQDEMDPLDGRDIHLWLQPWDPTRSLPSFPLYD